MCMDMWPSESGTQKEGEHNENREGLKKRNEKREEKRDAEKAQHRAFLRGPPPQYYPGSNLLNFAVWMGSDEPGADIVILFNIL